MKKIMLRFSKGFRFVLTTLMAVLTGMNVITIVLQVLFRYLFKRPIAWTNELAGISLVWITFLGATLATVDSTHIRFDTIKEKLKPRGAMVLKLVCNGFVLIACAVIFRYGLTAVQGGLNTKLTSLWGNFAMAVSIVPICAAFMFVATIANCAKDVRRYTAEKAGIGTNADAAVNALYDDVPEEILKRAEDSIRKNDAEQENQDKEDKP